MPASLSSNKDGLYFWLSEGDSFEGEFFIDDRSIATIDYVAGENGLDFVPVCEFDLLSDTQKIAINGVFTSQGKSYKINEVWKPVDVSAVTSPIFDADKKAAERLDDFAKLLETLSIKHGEDVVVSYSIQRTNQVHDQDFREAEARLGVSLPAVFREVASFDIELGDSYYLPLDQLDTLANMMKGWGENLDDLDDAVRARYERSIVAFVEVGDGLGAVAFDPMGVSPGEVLHARKGMPVNLSDDDQGQGVWFYFHQQSSHQPSLLVDGNNRPLNNTDAILVGVRNFALSGLVDELSYLGEFGALKFGDFGRLLPPHVLFDAALYSNYVTLNFEPKKSFLREKMVPTIKVRKYGGYGVE